MLQTVLTVRQLSKTFTPFFSAPTTAVSDFSCSIKRGEIVGLLGVNGAGKTTLMQMLLGTLLPTAGTIHYFGQDFAQHRSEILERVGFSASYSNLPWSMKVRQSLTFCAYLYAIPDRSAALARIVKEFSLQDLLDQRINELSSGQLARLNLAKAFLNSPQLLFLDEPTNYLDPQAAQMIRDYILKKRRTDKLTVLLASHNMQEVFSLCDRVIVLHKGKQILTGKPQDIVAEHFNYQLVLWGVADTPKNQQILSMLSQPFRFKKQLLLVTLPEKVIGTYLQQLTTNGLRYDTIQIKPPSLEAVFDPKFIDHYATS